LNKTYQYKVRANTEAAEITPMLARPKDEAILLMRNGSTFSFGGLGGGGGPYGSSQSIISETLTIPASVDVDLLA